MRALFSFLFILLFHLLVFGGLVALTAKIGWVPGLTASFFLSLFLSIFDAIRGDQ